MKQMSVSLVYKSQWSGAGPVGLTLSNLLTKYKINNTLIEKDKELSRKY